MLQVQSIVLCSDLHIFLFLYIYIIIYLYIYTYVYLHHVAPRCLRPPPRPEHDVQLRQSVRLSDSHDLPLLDAHKHRSLL